MSRPRNIDVAELEAKLQRMNAKSDNPTGKAYGDKLTELLNSRATARENFVNWITGLATAAMFLAFSNVASAPFNLRALLLFSGISSFLCILSAMAFQIFLEVRFASLELEVSLLKNIWEGHNIRSRLQQLMHSRRDVSEGEKQALLRNMADSLNYLDENRLKELKRPINFKTKLWIWSYWQTLVFFVTGVVLMALYYRSVGGVTQYSLAV